MAFLDGPFGFGPKQKYPGLFGTPTAPVSDSPPVNPGGSETRSYPQPVAPASSMLGGARPMRPVIAPGNGGSKLPPPPKPAPYAYSGPTMSILSGQQFKTDTTKAPVVPVPPRGPVTAPSGGGGGGGNMVNQIFGPGGGGTSGGAGMSPIGSLTPGSGGIPGMPGGSGGDSFLGSMSMPGGSTTPAGRRFNAMKK